MLKATIKLKNIESIKKFVAAIQKLRINVDLRSGSQEVDGKSIMGVCTLDLTKPIDLVAISDSETELDRLRGIIADFAA